MPGDCLFCGMVSGKVAAPHWIARSERAVAFLDIRPIRVGHTLVIPRRHAADLSDVPSEDWAAVNRLVRDVATRLRRTLGTDGENLLVASGPGSEQSVFHLHVHVIPRKRNDDLRWNDWWQTKTFAPPSAELAELAKKVRAD
jgi:histidine triad (HIT) family protein